MADRSKLMAREAGYTPAMLETSLDQNPAGPPTGAGGTGRWA